MAHSVEGSVYQDGAFRDGAIRGGLFQNGAVHGNLFQNGSVRGSLFQNGAIRGSVYQRGSIGGNGTHYHDSQPLVLTKGAIGELDRTGNLANLLAAFSHSNNNNDNSRRQQPQVQHQQPVHQQQPARQHPVPQQREQQQPQVQHQQPVHQQQPARQHPVPQQREQQQPQVQHQQPVHQQQPARQHPVPQQREQQQPQVQHQQPVQQQQQVLHQQPVPKRQPVQQQQPVQEHLVQQQPVHQQPMLQQPVRQQPELHQPDLQQPVHQQPVHQHSVLQHPMPQRSPSGSAAPANNTPPVRIPHGSHGRAPSSGGATHARKAVPGSGGALPRAVSMSGAASQGHTASASSVALRASSSIPGQHAQLSTPPPTEATVDTGYVLPSAVASRSNIAPQSGSATSSSSAPSSGFALSNRAVTPGGPVFGPNSAYPRARGTDVPSTARHTRSATVQECTPPFSTAPRFSSEAPASGSAASAGPPSPSSSAAFTGLAPPSGSAASAGSAPASGLVAYTGVPPPSRSAAPVRSSPPSRSAIPAGPPPPSALSSSDASQGSQVGPRESSTTSRQAGRRNARVAAKFEARIRGASHPPPTYSSGKRVSTATSALGKRSQRSDARPSSATSKIAFPSNSKTVGQNPRQRSFRVPAITGASTRKRQKAMPSCKLVDHRKRGHSPPTSSGPAGAFQSSAGASLRSASPKGSGGASRSSSSSQRSTSSSSGASKSARSNNANNRNNHESTSSGILTSAMWCNSTTTDRSSVGARHAGVRFLFRVESEDDTDLASYALRVVDEDDADMEFDRESEDDTESRVDKDDADLMYNDEDSESEEGIDEDDESDDGVEESSDASDDDEEAACSSSDDMGRGGSSGRAPFALTPEFYASIKRVQDEAREIRMAERAFDDATEDEMRQLLKTDEGMKRLWASERGRHFVLEEKDREDAQMLEALRESQRACMEHVRAENEASWQEYEWNFFPQ